MVLQLGSCKCSQPFYFTPKPNVIQNLKRIEVIEDDEGEIVEAARRMSEKYDFVVTRLVLSGNSQIDFRN